MMIVFSISRFNDCAPDRLILSSLLFVFKKVSRRQKKAPERRNFDASPSFRVLNETLNTKRAQSTEERRRQRRTHHTSHHEYHQKKERL
jgi:hypothetical protein